MARRQLTEMLGAAAGLVQVESAGTRAVVGAPVHPHTAAAVRRLQGDVDGFVARRLIAPMVAQADLVLTMTREHRRLALELCPRALSRSFTLPEAADLVRLLDAGSAVLPASDGRTPVQQMAAARVLRVGDERDDVADPVNCPAEVHQGVVELISESLRPVLRHVITGLPGLATERAAASD